MGWGLWRRRATLQSLATVAALQMGALVVAALPVRAQDTAATAASRVAAAPAGDAFRVFFDCPEVFANRAAPACRRDFWVNEFPWVNWTRDRIDADVQVLVSILETGGGGEQYTIAFLGRGAFASRVDTLRVATLPRASENTVRAQMANAVRAGLIPFAMRSPLASRLQIGVSEAGDGPRKAMTTRVNDPWNYWTYAINVGGNGSAESLQRFVNSFLGVDATRVTEGAKFTIGFFANQNESEFTLADSSVFSNRVRSLVAYNRDIFALSPHWSAGVAVRYDYDEFRNTALALRLAPVIEYNFFSFAEATNRQLTLSYAASIERFRYRDTTIFGLLEETRPRHLLTLGLSSRQSWGSAFMTGRAAQFLHDLSKSNVAVQGNIDLRVVKGLSVSLSGGAAQVRDQLYLARGGLSDAEILVRQRALATRYSFQVGLGLGYTFGSIYNSVVNPRLDVFRVGPN